MNLTNNVKNDRQKGLLERAQTLPELPGCYLMKGKEGRVIYVGKAKNLKRRVSSYFQQSQKSPKTEYMVSHIVHFEFVLCASDSEAFILENNLIKKYTPKYNLRLKDDKSYPYVVVDEDCDFPRLLYRRRVKREKGKRIYGPFPTGSNLGEVLSVAVKAFALRDCHLKDFQTRKNPCLLYQMKQCLAPCVGYVSASDYKSRLNLVEGIFSGNGKGAVKFLKERMDLAALNEEFELAAMLRDYLNTITTFLGETLQKNAEMKTNDSLDVIAYFKGESELDISVLMIRNGILIGNRVFHFPLGELLTSLHEEIVRSVFEYYSKGEDLLPAKIIFPQIDNEEESSFGEALEKISEGKIKFSKSYRNYKSLYELTLKQAEENQRYRFAHEEKPFAALLKLKELLNLKEMPRILECYDVAVFQGSSPTASQVVFHDGKPDKKNYRYYHLETRLEGNNDFAMLSEFFRRRVAHGDLPDLMVVDGGTPQVRTLLLIMRELKIEIPLIGIAKAKTESDFQSDVVEKSRERLVIPNRLNPYFLDKDRALLKLITGMRDEAHRFSRKLHHHAEKKRVIKN